MATDTVNDTLESHLKAISVYLKLLDDDGRDFASGVLAKFAKSPDSFVQAAAAIQGMLDFGKRQRGDGPLAKIYPFRRPAAVPRTEVSHV